MAEVLSPTFGVLGVGGVVALVAGGLLLFDREVPELALPLRLIGAVALASAAVVLLGGRMALQARRLPVVSGAEEMIGAPGVVLDLGEAGAWAQVHGERWRVTSAEALHPGQRIRVHGMHGLTLEVLPDPTTDGGRR